MRTFIIIGFFFSSTLYADVCETYFDSNFNLKSEYLNPYSNASRNINYPVYQECLRKKKNYLYKNVKVAIGKKQDQQELYDDILNVFGELPGLNFFAAWLRFNEGEDPMDDVISIGLANEAEKLQNNLNNLALKDVVDMDDAQNILKEFNSLLTKTNEWTSNPKISDKDKKIFFQLNNRMSNIKDSLIFVLIKKNRPDFSALSKEEKLNLVSSITGINELSQSELNKKVSDLNKQAKDIFKILNSNVEKGKEREAYLTRKALLRDYQMFSSASTQFIGLFDHDLASAVAPALNASFNIAIAVNRLNAINDGVEKGSVMGPYGMMAMAAMSLMSNNNSNAITMIDAIKQIGKQIARLHKDVLMGFDEVNMRLVNIEIRIMDRFNTVINQNHRIQNEIDELREELRGFSDQEIRASLQEIDAKKSNLLISFTEKSSQCINEERTVSECLSFYQDSLGNFKADNQYFVGSAIPEYQNKWLTTNYNSHIHYFLSTLSDNFNINIDPPLYPKYLELIKTDITLYLSTIKNVSYKNRKDVLSKELIEIDEKQKKFYKQLKKIPIDDLFAAYENLLNTTFDDVNEAIKSEISEFSQTDSSIIYHNELSNMENNGTHHSIYEKYLVKYGKRYSNGVEKYKNTTKTSLIDILKNNKLASSILDKPSVGADHINNDMVGYYWVLPCNKAKGHPSFAVSRNKLISVFGNKIMQLATLNKSRFNICYNANTKHGTFKPYLDLTHLPGGFRGVVQHTGYYLTSINFVLNASLQGKNKDIKILRKFEPEIDKMCFQLDSDKTSILSTWNLEKFAKCLTIKEHLITQMKNFSNSSDFKTLFKEKYLTNLNNTIELEKQIRRNYLINKITKSIKYNKILNDISYIIKAREYYISNKNSIPGWVNNILILPTSNVIDNSIRMHIQFNTDLDNILESLKELRQNTNVVFSNNSG